MINAKYFYLLTIAGLLLFPAIVFAQSGRAPLPAPTPATEIRIEKTNEIFEKSKVIISSGFNDFLQELNRLGKLGYKAQKSINFGGTGASQYFAAYLNLNEKSSYQYEWLVSPNKNFIETRLNSQARNGFEFADVFALTVCGEPDSKTDTNSSVINSNILNLDKGDVFLLVKEKTASTQSKEYKVITGKIGIGNKPTQVLQNELNQVPQGFRPVKILFNKTGLADFAISILLEKDSSSDNSFKIEYKFVKEVRGFDKEINALAAQGFRIISGRRIGLVKMALLAKETNDAAAYEIIDEEKYQKEFDKTIAAGNVYQGILLGDVDCDSQKKVNEKLLFTKNTDARKYDYKIVNLPVKQSQNFSGEINDKLKQFTDGNYRIKDLFYFDGLNIILEK